VRHDALKALDKGTLATAMGFHKFVGPDGVALQLGES
jgi:hypothetical protein